MGAHSQVEVISLWFLSNFLVILRNQTCPGGIKKDVAFLICIFKAKFITATCE